VQLVWKMGSTLAQCQPMALLSDHSAYRDADARVLGQATGQYRSGGASANDHMIKGLVGLRHVTSRQSPDDDAMLQHRLGLTPVAPEPLGHQERMAFAICTLKPSVSRVTSPSSTRFFRGKREPGGRFPVPMPNSSAPSWCSRSVWHSSIAPTSLVMLQPSHRPSTTSRPTRTNSISSIKILRYIQQVLLPRRHGPRGPMTTSLWRGSHKDLHGIFRLI